MEKLTGTALALSALKTKKSIGCGEYPDLAVFADFCKKSNLGIIQLLPVNDTGTSSSPYNALSAFALHPLYISIGSLPEAKKDTEIKKQLEKLSKKHNNKKRFCYTDLRKDKITLLHTVYNKHADQINESEKFARFIEKNTWLPYYCVYMVLKEKNNEASWKEWTSNKQLGKKEIIKLWENKKYIAKHRFYAWLQMRAHEQFSKSARYVKKQNILLKGDIPILMNEDSVDAWAFPEYFDTRLRAGSPADNMNPSGQNWGFPTYNWKNLKRDSYSWWKNRLKQASKYYKIYRIDHVLGFFRIWSIKEGECTALNGWPEPSIDINIEKLYEMGYNEERIRWMSQPHVPTNAVEAVNNNDYLAAHGEMGKIMNKIENEELWLFKPEIGCDQDIWDREDIPFEIRKVLTSFWTNRMLIQKNEKSFYPQWTYKNSTAWQSLSPCEREQFNKLVEEIGYKNEAMWANQAQELLGILKKSTKMIPCAEDLGSNPDCVPKVLNDLGILGLRVIRWNRIWDEQGQPYVAFNDYPELSVVTTSVHDSSTLRLWWLKENDANDFLHYFPPLDSSIHQGEYTEKTAEYLLGTVAQSSSFYCIHPIQDFLSLKESYNDNDPEAERINIPGSVTDFNWTYRLPAFVSELVKDDDLCNKIAHIAALHA